MFHPFRILTEERKREKNRFPNETLQEKPTKVMNKCNRHGGSNHTITMIRISNTLFVPNSTIHRKMAHVCVVLCNMHSLDFRHFQTMPWIYVGGWVCVCEFVCAFPLKFKFQVHGFSVSRALSHHFW